MIFIWLNRQEFGSVPQIQPNSEEYVWFDEPHPFRVRSFTYRVEQARANEVKTVIVYRTKNKGDFAGEKLVNSFLLKVGS
jgi:hypothetical protein